MPKKTHRNISEITEEIPKLPKHIIDMADYVFANSEVPAGEIAAEYCKKYRKCRRTIETWLKKAREYNYDRIAEREKIRAEEMVSNARKTIKLDLMTRNEAISILTMIARGKQRDGNDNSIIPTDNERIRAIERLSKMDGWDMPNKTELTGANGKDIIPSITVEVIDNREQVKSDED